MKRCSFFEQVFFYIGNIQYRINSINSYGYICQFSVIVYYNLSCDCMSGGLGFNPSLCIKYFVLRLCLNSDPTLLRL